MRSPWRLHQRRGILFLAFAARRTRTPPPYRRTLSCSLRPGGGLARGPAPRQQRRAGLWRRGVGDAVPPVGGFLRLLATRAGRLAGCGKTPERLLFPEFSAADAG